MKFADRASLDSYGPHPVHQELVSWLMPLIERSKWDSSSARKQIPDKRSSRKMETQVSGAARSLLRCACLEPRTRRHAYG